VGAIPTPQVLRRKRIPDIPDQFINEIATDGGQFKPLNFQEVGKLCERLNTKEDQLTYETHPAQKERAP
jgi:hypothetical protein